MRYLINLTPSHSLNNILTCGRQHPPQAGIALFALVLAAVLLSACATTPQNIGRDPASYIGVPTITSGEANVLAELAENQAATAQVQAALVSARETSIAMPTHTAIAATVSYNETTAAMNLQATRDHQALALARAETELTREAEAVEIELSREADSAVIVQLQAAEDIAATRMFNELELAKEANRNALARTRSIGWSIGFPVVLFLILAFIALLFSLREKTTREVALIAAEAASLRDKFLETSYGPIFVYFDVTGQTLYRQIEPPAHMLPEVVDPETELRRIPFSGQQGKREPITVEDAEGNSGENERILATSLLEAVVAWQQTNDSGPLVIPRWDALPGWNSTGRAQAVDILVRANLVEVIQSVGTKIRPGWISAERLLASIQDDPEILTAPVHEPVSV